ncbi:MAG: hypothetical protein Phog2KO_51330 [Phototrophicaceae bacterium]
MLSETAETYGLLWESDGEDGGEVTLKLHFSESEDQNSLKPCIGNTRRYMRENLPAQ